MKVFTAQKMQEIDRRTIEDIGIPGIVLMENAGRGTFSQIMKRFPDKLKKQVSVICGKGNNGGDGFVIARYLNNIGVNVSVLLLAPEHDIKGDALINLTSYKKISGSVIEVSDKASWIKTFNNFVCKSELIIDAIFGTGLSSEVRGLYRTVIDNLNNLSDVSVVSVDIPSGIDASSGRILGTAVSADLTCTFGFSKTGLVMEPGKSRAGTIEIIDIGIPPNVVKSDDIDTIVPDNDYFHGLLPERKPDSHKGSFGHALIIAGSKGKTGAASLCGMAAMRSGTGLVTLAVPGSMNNAVESKTLEIMTEPLADSIDGTLTKESIPRIIKLLEGKNAVAIGPGLSVTDDTKTLLVEFIKLCQVPVVIDADGLNILAENLSILKNRSSAIILTPHPGEMSRLTGLSTRQIQENRVETARNFSIEHQVYLVLKGSGTVICNPYGRTFINPTGNPGMASGGMGDALTGIITGLLAQGLNTLDAAVFGVFAHGMAGDIVAKENAPTGLLASDVIERIPSTLNCLLWK